MPTTAIAVVVLTHNRVHCCASASRTFFSATSAGDAGDRDLEQRLDGRDARVSRHDRGSAHHRRPARDEHGSERICASVRATTSRLSRRARRRRRQRSDALGPDAARALCASCRRSVSSRPIWRTTRTTSRRMCVTGSGRTSTPRRRERRPAALRADRRCVRDHLAGALRPCRRLPPAQEVHLLAGGGGVHRRHRVAGLRRGSAGGPEGPPHRRASTTASTTPRRTEFWAFYWKKQARRAAVKRLVFRVPFFRRLNARFDWFVAPS